MLKQVVIAFFLMGICVVIHIAGIVFAAEQLVSRERQIEARHESASHIGLLLMSVFVFITALHLVEACIWAVFYYAAGLFETLETTLYFSLKTYSTVGYGDVVLPEHWRLLGTLEGISGVLLCGVSTAFLFTIMNALFRFRIERARTGKGLTTNFHK